MRLTDLIINYRVMLPDSLFGRLVVEKKCFRKLVSSGIVVSCQVILNKNWLVKFVVSVTCNIIGYKRVWSPLFFTTLVRKLVRNIYDHRYLL